jgi:hypothetical protein
MLTDDHEKNLLHLMIGDTESEHIAKIILLKNDEYTLDLA